MGDLTKNFSRSEFACPCCGKSDIDPHLVQLLQELRDEINAPVEIESGVRCQKHNIELATKGLNPAPDSAHLYGKAADIHCTDSSMRYKLLKSAFRRFRRIEVKDIWIHVDIDETKPQDVCF